MAQEIFEARSWLAANKNPSAFASNHFGKTEKAREFMDALYAAGAPYVGIWERFMEEEGPYSDTLYVAVPAGEKGVAVLDLIRDAHPDELELSDYVDPENMREDSDIVLSDAMHNALVYYVWWD